MHTHPPVAQSVEQLPFKETVAGSIPAGRTNRLQKKYIMEKLQTPESNNFPPEKRTEFLLNTKINKEGALAELEEGDFLRYAGVPSELITEEINQLPMIEHLDKARDIGVVATIKDASWSYMDNRPVLFTKVGGQNVPFYRSSEGTGGNKTAGKWYPFFGIGAQGWIIKGKGDDHETGYHNPALNKLQGIFNETFNWEHELDFLKTEEFTKHPLTQNKDAMKLFCPPAFLDLTLFGKKDLSEFDIENYRSKHKEWIEDILNTMYEKYPQEFIDEVIKLNTERLAKSGYLPKK